MRTIFVYFLLNIYGIAMAQTSINHPPKYNCKYTNDSITIDGEVTDLVWEDAEWTADFGDILGHQGPIPKYTTHVKMLWDSQYLYIAAELYEPHIWATLTERDAIIYRDTDFEVFIDPDNNGELYYEIEINAYNTIMDLMMTKPYYQGGKYIMAMDFRNIKSAIKIDGTINNPTDIDNKWTVEMAIPLVDLCEQFTSRKLPTVGDRWRINFSRVNWDRNITKGAYTEKKYPEYNWVWSPQGVKDMHRPSQWGWLEFCE